MPWLWRGSPGTPPLAPASHQNSFGIWDSASLRSHCPVWRRKTGPHVASGLGTGHARLGTRPGRMEKAPHRSPVRRGHPTSRVGSRGAELGGGCPLWSCHRGSVKPSRSPSLSLCPSPALSCSIRKLELPFHPALSPFTPSSSPQNPHKNRFFGPNPAPYPPPPPPFIIFFFPPFF